MTIVLPTVILVTESMTIFDVKLVMLDILSRLTCLVLFHATNLVLHVSPTVLPLAQDA